MDNELILFGKLLGWYRELRVVHETHLIFVDFLPAAPLTNVSFGLLGIDFQTGLYLNTDDNGGRIHKGQILDLLNQAVVPMVVAS